MDIRPRPSTSRAAKSDHEEIVERAALIDPDEPVRGIRRPHSSWDKEQAADWVPFARSLAERNMNMRDIAGMMRAPYGAVKGEPHIQGAVREGQARYRFIIETGLFNLATLDESLAEDSVERAAIRTTKLRALSIMKTSIDKKDEFVSPAEQEKLRRLSDDELKMALKEAAKEL